MRNLEQTWVRESGCKCDVPHKPGYIDNPYGGEGLSIWPLLALSPNRVKLIPVQ